jgi:hypothetical protein
MLLTAGRIRLLSDLPIAPSVAMLGSFFDCVRAIGDYHTTHAPTPNDNAHTYTRAL